jgi:hypothetical protein
VEFSKLLPSLSVNRDSLRRPKMATKKKAAKKKTAAKSIAVTSILRWNPRRGGDPPPPFYNRLDLVAQKQFADFVNKALAKGQRARG